MELIPTQEQVREVLERTGALRSGHFRHPNGTHADVYLQMPMAMRHYSESKMLSVALSRRLRQEEPVRRMLPNVSIVTPAVGGLPVAFGVAEALRAAQTYWAEKQDDGSFDLRQFMSVHPGERVILVDDIMRTGNKLSQLHKLVEAAGAQTLALAVLVHQPYDGCLDFGPLPVYSLLKLEPHYWSAGNCPLCARGETLTEVRV